MLLLSLIGEQPLPSLLPVRFLKPRRTVLVYTQKTETVARHLRRVISGQEDLDQDLCTDAYNLNLILEAMQKKIAGQEPVIYNLTGGTKMMALAGYALAASQNASFCYLESGGGRSNLLKYGFSGGLPRLETEQPLPKDLLTARDFLLSHLPGYKECGYSRDDNGQLNIGGEFEQAVHQALLPHFDETLVGVRPDGVGNLIEIDLLLRSGNHMAIVEVKMGGADYLKKGLDQLKMAGEGVYLGTYTSLFMIVAAPRVPVSTHTLAARRNIHLLQLPDYQSGLPIPYELGAELARRIHEKMDASPAEPGGRRS